MGAGGSLGLTWLWGAPGGYRNVLCMISGSQTRSGRPQK
jgi:hypothetical protein